MKEDLVGRIERAEKLLQQRQINAVIATSSANVFYFTDTWVDPHERVLAVVLKPDGRHTVIAPELHRHDFIDGPFEFRFWQDGEDALRLLADSLPNRGSVAIDSRCPSHQLLALQEQKPHLAFIASDALTDLRTFKDRLEIEWLTTAGARSCDVMEQILSILRPGITELEIADKIISMFRKVGLDGPSFVPIVAAGSNAASPHHDTGDKPLQSGELVVIDMGGSMHHYCADMTRTFAIGTPSATSKEVYEVVRIAQEAAFSAVKPGVLLGDVDATARAVIEAAGYGSYFIHRTGHGLGIEIHEEPYVYSGNAQQIQEGMVFTIEPGIYIPDQIGVRIEDTVVVTANGCRSFNPTDKQLRIL